MNDRCGYCGGVYELDCCVHCGRMQGEPPRRFIVYGPGYMGDYDTIEQAQALLHAHPKLGPAALYVRSDEALGGERNG